MQSFQFQSLPLSPEILRAIESLGFLEMTEIQKLSLSHILEGSDVFARSKTGSGKTVAFGAGVLDRLLKGSLLSTSFAYPKALVLCPTRELAEQVSAELRRLGSCIANLRIVTLCGGTSSALQRERLQSGAHIIVGTPGRIIDKLENGGITFKETEVLVLDEADRMLDMGFIESIEQILTEMPLRKQTLLFSATFPDAIDKLSRTYQRNPVRVEAEAFVSHELLDEVFLEIEAEKRVDALESLLYKERPKSVLVFCATKLNCNNLALDLQGRGFNVLALHSDFDQRQRTEVLARFNNKSCTLLVATDVAARGLDIKDLDVVVNYDLSPDSEVHVHRIGRTGRADQKGKVWSFYTNRQVHRLESISQILKRPVNRMPFSLYLGRNAPAASADIASQSGRARLVPEMVTLSIGGGRKSKLRRGDIVGALTGEAGLESSQIGIIEVFDHFSFVAVQRDLLKNSIGKIMSTKFKGVRFKVKVIDETVADMLEKIKDE